MGKRFSMFVWMAMIYGVGIVVGYRLFRPLRSGTEPMVLRGSERGRATQAVENERNAGARDRAKEIPRDGDAAGPPPVSVDEFGNIILPAALLDRYLTPDGSPYSNYVDTDGLQKLGLNRSQIEKYGTMLEELKDHRLKWEKSAAVKVTDDGTQTMVCIPSQPDFGGDWRAGVLEQLHQLLRPDQEAAEYYLTKNLAAVTGGWGTDLTYVYVHREPADRGGEVAYEIIGVPGDTQTFDGGDPSVEALRKCLRWGITTWRAFGEAPPEEIRHLFNPTPSGP